MHKFFLWGIKSHRIFHYFLLPWGSNIVWIRISYCTLIFLEYNSRNTYYLLKLCYFVSHLQRKLIETSFCRKSSFVYFPKILQQFVEFSYRKQNINSFHLIYLKNVIKVLAICFTCLTHTLSDSSNTSTVLRSSLERLVVK